MLGSEHYKCVKMTYKVARFGDHTALYCMVQLEDESPEHCATNLLHTFVGPGVFLFYDIYCSDVERPPAPSPVCNKLVAPFWATFC